MKCLQCGNSATVAETVNGYEVRQCADGHRTGQLTAAQTAEILEKMAVETDTDGNAVLPVKKSKRSAVKRAA